MKQITIFIISIVLLLQLNACLSSQAFSKATYISNDAVFIKSAKITDLSIIAICNATDRATYETLTNKLKTDLITKNINSNISFFTDVESLENIRSSMQGSYQLVINPVKDEYVKDEMNNPVISKQILFNLQKSGGEKVADIAVAIDRIEKADKLGNQISNLVFSYLKKKKFI